MSTTRFAWYALIGLISLSSARGTSVPQLSLEKLIDESDAVVSGVVMRTWSEWDAQHQFIWTRAKIRVNTSHKGAVTPAVIVSEIGGEADGQGMMVAGSPRYEAGDRVVTFLKSYAGLGFRTHGWSQGKFQVDAAGKVHGVAPSAAEVKLGRAAAKGETPLPTLEGITLQELTNRISARVHQGAVK